MHKIISFSIMILVILILIILILYVLISYKNSFSIRSVIFMIQIANNDLIVGKFSFCIESGYLTRESKDLAWQC